MTLLAAALEYAQHRWPVFPCAVRGKVPAIARGFYAASTNPETIRRYWREADRNIGIPTGSLSGFWVLDIDGDAGEASLREIEAKHGALPATLISTTGNGKHFWFVADGSVPCSTAKIGAGVDVKGDGGYVVVPPSIHPSGKKYSWLDASIVPSHAPDWLLQLARRKPARPTISELALANIRRTDTRQDAYGLAALEAEVTALAAAAPGWRNHALNCVAFRLFQLVAGGELDQAQVIERLIDACHRNGLVADDGWRTVMATIRSGMNAGLKFPRSRSGAA